MARLAGLTEMRAVTKAERKVQEVGKHKVAQCLNDKGFEVFCFSAKENHMSASSL